MTQKQKADLAGRGRFSKPESFGLFMDALRELQIYEDEASKSDPDHDRLKSNLEVALESLEKCYASFPADLLPRYYLGITLAMQNQREYAREIWKRQADPQLLTPGNFTPFPRMQWPLLDRAVSLFDDLRSCGIRELEVSANFNLAQMYVRREKNGDLDRATTLLNLSPQPQKRAATAWDEAGRSILGYESESLRTARRAYVEALARRFQERTLIAIIDGRLALRRGDASRDSYDASKAELAKIRDEIDADADVTVNIRHDLLADSWTKSGRLVYEAAFAGPDAEKQETLHQAEGDLREALMYKRNWIPAQTYLAQVFQAQGNLPGAAEQLQSVLGRLPSA
jgi:hypothetical protein